ncbi:MAG: hypothetical protein FWG73_07705 [Planctomycetaceae bacterium]|nr:hypothetical protein [Planctomycetaceae bacterium]
MPPKKAKSSPKQPAVYRQKRHNRQDTAFVIIDGQRIHLGIFGTPEAETEYRRLVAEWNANIVAPKQINSADCTVAELVLRFLKEREGKVSHTQWDNERRTAAVLVSLYGDADAAAFDVNGLRAVRHEFIQKRYVRRNDDFCPKKK